VSAESRAAAVYVSIWVYRVRPEALVEFVRHYSSGGAWARLFGQAAGYRQTRLLADPSDRGRYVTIDEWASAAAYCEFRARWQVEFSELDRRCEPLTIEETPLGEFEEVRA
jgi:heme-degrading monooxygenase HmoA